MQFGTGNGICWLPIHSIVHDKASALPFFHSFTGCDQVEGFKFHGKKIAWKTWMAFPKFTPLFQQLTKTPESIATELFNQLQEFVCLMYDASTMIKEVNKLRHNPFTTKHRAYDNLPPTKDALELHSCRSVYMGGHRWSQALVRYPNLPCPSLWAWFWDVLNGKFNIKWLNQSSVADAIRIFTVCGCKTCKKRCKCFKVDLKCSTLCSKCDC